MRSDLAMRVRAVRLRLGLSLFAVVLAVTTLSVGTTATAADSMTKAHAGRYYMRHVCPLNDANHRY